MKYYKLVYDYDNDEHFINCDIAHIGGVDEYCTSSGMSLDEWGEYFFEFDSHDGNIVSDYIANVCRWFMVTNDFIDYVLCDLNEQKYQILPVMLLDKAKCMEIIQCQVVNVLDVVDDALDLNHSKYDIFELDDEKIISVEKYALKKTKVEGHDIFKIKEDIIPIFVSEKVKFLIEEHKLKGFQFIEIHVN